MIEDGTGVFSGQRRCFLARVVPKNQGTTLLSSRVGNLQPLWDSILPIQF